MEKVKSYLNKQVSKVDWIVSGALLVLFNGLSYVRGDFPNIEPFLLWVILIISAMTYGK